MPAVDRLLAAALTLLVAMAHVVIAGARGVSITLPPRGRLGTVASSNEAVLQIDADQNATGQGPCLDAAQHGHRVHAQELATEAGWPAFVPRAPARPIASILSTPRLAGWQPLGALNIYSQQPRWSRLRQSPLPLGIEAPS